MVKLRLVDCHYKYWDFILSLRNKLREGFIDQKDIQPESHHHFMVNNSTSYKVCLSDTNAPVGFVGQVDGDIRVATCSGMQGKGVAKFMITEFIKDKDVTYQAKVKKENEASLALFRSCGFEEKYIILEK
tara:strand:- start:1199 stop:1588 length:390 start_codon:yes stop_codon:yes gene_type:complete